MADTGEREPVATCGNCGIRPGVVAVNGVPLCVNCWAILQRAERDRIETHMAVADDMARMINFLGAQVDASARNRVGGSIPGSARYEPSP